MTNENILQLVQSWKRRGRAMSRTAALETSGHRRALIFAATCYANATEELAALLPGPEDNGEET